MWELWKRRDFTEVLCCNQCSFEEVRELEVDEAQEYAGEQVLQAGCRSEKMSEKEDDVFAVVCSRK